MKYSRQELCRRYKNDRNTLYKQRKKLILQQDATPYSNEKKWAALQKKREALDKKINSYRVKIFKCGKKFEKLKTARKKNIDVKYALGKKLQELSARGGDEKEKNKLRSKIGEVAMEIRKMDALMGKDIIEEKGKIEVFTDKIHGVFRENIPVWQLVEELNYPLESGKYDFIYIDGAEFSVSKQKAAILFEIDDYIDRIHLSQANRKTKTPMVWIILSEDARTISVQQDLF